MASIPSSLEFLAASVPGPALIRTPPPERPVAGLAPLSQMLRRADEGPAGDRQAGGAVDWSVRERGCVQFALDLPGQPVPRLPQGRQDLAGVEVAGIAGAVALDRRGSCLNGRRAELADAGVELFVAGAERGHAVCAERGVRVGHDLADDPPVVFV